MLSWLKSFSLKQIIGVLAGMFIAFAVVCVVLFSTIYVQSNSFNSSWLEFQKGASQKQELITDLKKNLGYGGMIHNFKNYVLRGEEKYYKKVIQQGYLIKKNIAQYMSLNISTNEVKNLETILQITNEYIDAAKKAKSLQKLKKSISEIDAVVKIDDSPAIIALKELNTGLIEQNQKEQTQVSSLLQNILEYSLIGAIVIFIGTILLVIIFLIIGYKFIIKPILAAKKSAVEISRGHYVISDEISGFREAESLRQSFERMKDLVANEIHNAKDSLSLEISESTNLANLSEGLSKKIKITQLANYITSSLAELLDAQCITLFIKEFQNTENNNSSFKLISSYAYSNRTVDKILPGEGLIGQCAVEKKPIILTEIPNDYLRIQSSLVDKAANSIYIIPVLFNETILGVIELASFKDFSQRTLNFLMKIANIAGININNAINLEKLEKTLSGYQELNNELNSQQEKLQETNSKLEEKTKILQQSEEELQAQSEELRVINEELEEKTESLIHQKKTLEVTQQDLKQRAEELALSSKYKSEFLANMSHELRTPLNSLLILSKKLSENKENNLTEKQVKSAEIIHCGGKELLTLINDILDLSKIEAGKLQIEISPCDIHKICENIYSQFDLMMSEKGLKFEVNIDPLLPDIFYCDEQRIIQIMRNFISNAYKFTESGTIKLKIEHPDKGINLYGKQFEPEDVIAWSVIDTGIGIPISKQRLIFEAFQQAEGSTSRKYGGTGLGLAISRAMAELLGGDIALESVEGKGSKFILYLPNITNPLSNSVNKNNDKNIVTASDANVSNTIKQLNSIDNEKIAGPTNVDNIVLMIIEDDVIFAELISELAKGKGYQTVVISSGHEALMNIDKIKPDAIILDLGLPDIDGMIVLEKLKNNPQIQKTPIHIISGRDKPSGIEKTGIIGYLKKPVSNESLYNVFNQFESAIKEKIKSILLIEDDKNSQHSINQLIESDNMKVHIEGSGKAALEYLMKNFVDCIILDINLPDMSGFDVLKKLSKSNQKLPPIIVYTGRELTEEEYAKLQQYTSSVIVKGADSPKRLMDDLTLFLHSIESGFKKKNQNTIKMLHSGDNILDGKKIILVDDDMRNVFALSSELEEYNLDIVIASNGEQAIKKLNENEDADLVLMDIMMPVMDGYTAIKAIRSDDRFKKTPIITLTAKAMAEDRDKSIAVGANDYISKPIDIDQLISMLKIWLSKK